jgi:hypothetical protein
MIDALANDSDAADGDTISISSVGNPSHGKTLIVLGKIRYTPNEDYAGPDSFTYTVSDGNGGTAEADVSVLVEQVNDAPVAKNDTVTVSEDSIATSLPTAGRFPSRSVPSTTFRKTETNRLRSSRISKNSWMY